MFKSMLSSYELNTFCLTTLAYLIGGIASAHFEVSPHLGMSFKKGIPITYERSGEASNMGETDKHTLLFGMDALHNFSLATNQSIGVGLRYQSSYTPAGDRDASLLDEIGSRRSHRVAILANYRWHFNESFFLGPLLGIDVFRSIKYELLMHDVLDPFEVNISQSLGTGQLGIEAAFKITPLLLIKAEAGYRLLYFNENVGESDERKWDMSGLYALVGMGLSF